MTSNFCNGGHAVVSFFLKMCSVFNVLPGSKNVLMIITKKFFLLKLNQMASGNIHTESRHKAHTFNMNDSILANSFHSFNPTPISPISKIQYRLNVRK